ncbi:MAG: PIN domain-containing protein [Aigarchaeota archaeon]|nr:PIN domain-containing protein [Candidatus Pelearchaeum maunauluense]
MFLDSNVFIAFYNKRDSNHTRAVELINMIANADLGTPYTSDYIFDEAVTTALARTGRMTIALNLGRMILGEITKPFVTMLKVDEDAFRMAWLFFKNTIEKH